MSSPCCLCVCESPCLKARTNLYETWYIYIMAPEPMSTTYCIDPSHQSLCLYVYPPVVVRQRLSENVTAATNTHAAIE
jgi:hypothetical protein